MKNQVQRNKEYMVRNDLTTINFNINKGLKRDFQKKLIDKDKDMTEFFVDKVKKFVK